MTDKTYNWKRYWFPRGSKVFLGPEGYLINPESDLGRLANCELVTLESVADVPCLVMLGEPGIGKTNALESLIRLKANHWQDEGAVIESYDLRSYGSEDRLVRDLFETRQFEEWLQAESPLVLSLDSLDECLLRIDTVATLIVDELRRRSIPVGRLRLRITCRTAVWPEVLEKGLNNIWGEQAVRIIEMAPLMLEDMAVAAQSNGIDPSVFIDALYERGAVPLATKPVTLELLIQIFLATGELPNTTTELYERGLRKLCEETNDSRRASRRIGNLDPDQRLAVAARMAAMITLAGKEAVWIGLDDGDLRESDIPYGDLWGGTEGIRGSCFNVDEAAILETLDTSLFVASGPNSLGFFHATYAEFLTAKYLTRHEMKVPQIMSLLSYSGVVGDRLAPQQHGTAAWLAAMRTDVFRALAKTDPSVLLRSDVSTATDSDRHQLVSNMLRLYNEESVLPPRVGSRHLYRKLHHPRLVDQIIEYISDKSKTSLARCEALEIARFCKLKACQDPALDIFLDPSEEEPVRRTAGYVLLAVGDETTKSRMRLLAYGDHPEDVNDELKGITLKALWPYCMSSGELFSIITQPQRDSFYGSYMEFLHLLPSTLVAPDLPAALSWVSRQPSRQSLSYALRDLMDGIMIAAWGNLKYPVVARALANASLMRLELDYSLVERFPDRKNWIDIVGDRRNRRVVIQVLVQRFSGSPSRVVQLASSQTPLVLSEDFSWLMDRMDEHEDEAEQRVMAKLIRMVFNRQDRTQVEQILAQVQHNIALGEEFSWFWRPVALDSPEADKMRADYAKQRDFERVISEQERAEEEAYEQLLRLLDECEAGQPWLFSTVIEELLLKPKLPGDPRLLETDVTGLPGWERSDGAVKTRILQAAKRYLTEHRAKPQDWFVTNQFDSGVSAGYKSFRLILAEEKEHLIAIPEEVWREWAPVILAYPTRLGFGDEQMFMQLVSVAFLVVPDAIANALTVLLDKENRENGTIMVTRKVSYCRGPEVEKVLLAKLRDDAFTADSTEIVLNELFAREVPQAKDYAEDLVKNAPHLQGIERQKCLGAASLLVIHTKVDGWRVVWPVILTDDDFGQSIIPKIAAWDRINDSQILKSLLEDELGQLFVWLTKRYPHHEDPRHDGFHQIEIREEIADWRDSILSELRDRATPEALDALAYIQDEFPGLSWLKWTLAEAYEIHRKKYWLPPEPREILEMALDTRKRLVRSEQELLQVVEESLRSLEEELQGETPAAVFLWDHIKHDRYKPKGETDLSDYIKLHLANELKARGVIVNREVEIHRGERTDVHVNAVSTSPRDGIYDSVTVILEVKGCWHRELWNAMENQLVGQYMTNNACKAGIYVVGWFNCIHWCSQDQKTKKLSQQILAMDISQAQGRLDAQANTLSSGRYFLRAMVLNTGLHKA